MPNSKTDTTTPQQFDTTIRQQLTGKIEQLANKAADIMGNVFEKTQSATTLPPQVAEEVASVMAKVKPDVLLKGDVAACDKVNDVLTGKVFGKDIRVDMSPQCNANRAESKQRGL
jgi:hypothetical protein